MDEGLILLIVFGVLILIILLMWLIICICDKIMDYRVSKIEKKYPELVLDMKVNNHIVDLECRYWNENIAPLRRKIDNLVADNYLQSSYKEKQLKELRCRLCQLMETYKDYQAADKKTRKDVQAKVDEIYKTDKRIKIIWTPSCLKENNK